MSTSRNRASRAWSSPTISRAAPAPRSSADTPRCCRSACRPKARTLREAVTWYHGLAEGNCYCDVSFHLIVTDPTPQALGQDLPALVADGYTSIKVFMTYEGMKLSDKDILRTLEAAKTSGALAMVHAENDDMIEYLRDGAEARGETAPENTHATTRPVPAEREATHRAIALAEVIGTPIVIVHVSNRDANGGNPGRPRARQRGLRRDLPAVSGARRPTTWTAPGSTGRNTSCSPPPRDYRPSGRLLGGAHDRGFPTSIPPTTAPTASRMNRARNARRG